MCRPEQTPPTTKSQGLNDKPEVKTVLHNNTKTKQVEPVTLGGTVSSGFSLYVYAEGCFSFRYHYGDCSKCQSTLEKGQTY